MTEVLNIVAFDANKASGRLKELRETRIGNGKDGKMSQSEMAKMLADRVGHNTSHEKGIVLDGVNGKQTVSQLERGARGITIDIAFAYADIFAVSLDYVLGRTDDWQPGYKDVKEVLGLSDEAINELKLKKDNSRAKIPKENHPTRGAVNYTDYRHELKAIDFLICNGHEFLQALYKYVFAWYISIPDCPLGEYYADIEKEPGALSHSHMCITLADRQKEYTTFNADELSDMLLMRLTRLLPGLRDIVTSSLPEPPQSIMSVVEQNKRNREAKNGKHN